MLASLVVDSETRVLLLQLCSQAEEAEVGAELGLEMVVVEVKKQQEAGFASAEVEEV
jgi:hypothetical protein